MNNPFVGTYSSWQTGGAGAGSIAAATSEELPWPPTTIAHISTPGAVSLLPTYTNTAPAETLTMAAIITVNGAQITASAGNGWENPNDTGGGPTAVAGCTYPDPWDALTAAMPTAPCPSVAAAAAVTPPPTRK